MSQQMEDNASNQQKLVKFGRQLWDGLKSLQGSPSDIRIGIWGTSGAGKTTYLARLHDALALSDDWTIQANKEASLFVDAHLSKIGRGEFPERTPIQTREPLKIFSYILTPQRRNRRNQRQPIIGSGRIFLNFVDAPGEFYEKVRINESGKKTVETKEGGHVGSIVDYLISCDGILFLLDPVRSEKDGDAYSDLLRRLFLEFQNRVREQQPNLTHLEQYVAFGVTKVDRQEFWSSSRTSEPHELAKHVLGSKIFNQLKNYYWIEPDVERRKQEKYDPSKRGKINRCDFFSIAAIGRYKDDKGEWREAVIYPDREEAKKPEVTQAPPIAQPNADIPTVGVYSGFNFTPNSHSTEPSSQPEHSIPSPEPSASRVTRASIYEDLVESPSEQSVSEAARINQRVDFEAMGVLEPIEWLIQGIQNCPPKRSPRVID